jgi:uncharacterized repeat protein (TIGR03803 family)
MKPNIRLLWLVPSLIVGIGAILADRSEAQTFTVLHSFTALVAPDYTNGDGTSPNAGLLLAGDTFYGATTGGGTYSNPPFGGSGTVFALNSDGTSFRTLYNFTAVNAPFLLSPWTNGDGAFPQANLILSGDILYGTTWSGGISGFGTLFALNTNGSGFTNLYTFTGGNDGAHPQASLLLSSGVLYGTTAYGGTNGTGAVFAINIDGTGFKKLHSFAAFQPRNSGLNSDGDQPCGELILCGNTLYGTAGGGGTNGQGTIFALGTNGADFVVLHTFHGTNGDSPQAAMALSGSTLYGTTHAGGIYDVGTVFAIYTDGTGFTNLYSFTGGGDGSEPQSHLVALGSSLYGATSGGGTNGTGTIFTIRTDGTGFVSLYNFTAQSGNSLTNSDGADTYGGIILSGNTLYGTAPEGGAAGNGTIFSLTLPLPPQLTITMAGTNVVLTWATNAMAYTLQSSGSLVPPVAWSAVLPLPAVVNGQNTVTNPVAATQQFYRLSQ